MDRARHLYMAIDIEAALSLYTFGNGMYTNGGFLPPQAKRKHIPVTIAPFSSQKT